ncbi:MAG: DNA repair protein RadC [Lachnospiraceae bacterium]|nr:DNA repair protein RadC [Lachnospiraceae bacterium]
MQNQTNLSQMPYERFLSCGPGALTDSELLAVILRTGTRGMSATDLAQHVLHLGKTPHQGLLSLYELPLEDLKAVKGIGEVKAVKLKCIAELSMRLSMARTERAVRCNDSASVAAYFMEQMRHLSVEVVMLACFDGKMNLIASKRLSEGSVNFSLISTRTVFLEALRHHAVNIILLHNHPSGDPTPSRADLSFTGKVVRAGKDLDIPLQDHIIIGDGVFFSFHEHRLLEGDRDYIPQDL